MRKAFQEHGLPERLRGDNGRPQQNGWLERMHRVPKAETARPPAANRCQQQTRFDRFRDEYNQVRPHEALAGEAVGLVEVVEGVEEEAVADPVPRPQGGTAGRRPVANQAALEADRA